MLGTKQSMAYEMYVNKYNNGRISVLTFTKAVFYQKIFNSIIH